MIFTCERRVEMTAEKKCQDQLRSVVWPPPKALILSIKNQHGVDHNYLEASASYCRIFRPLSVCIVNLLSDHVTIEETR